MRQKAMHEADCATSQAIVVQSECGSLCLYLSTYTTAAAIPASLKAQGWSNARAFSATQLRQNPNTFFYRNVAPDQQQVGLQHLL